jgi:hypothetical protein
MPVGNDERRAILSGLSKSAESRGPGTLLQDIHTVTSPQFDEEDARKLAKGDEAHVRLGIDYFKTTRRDNRTVAILQFCEAALKDGFVSSHNLGRLFHQCGFTLESERK